MTEFPGTEAVISVIQKRIKPPCPMCGANRNMSVEDGFSWQELEPTVGGPVALGRRQGISVITTVCGDCGFVAHYSASVLKLM